MSRRAFLPGILSCVAVAALVLTGCSSSGTPTAATAASSSASAAESAESGDATESAATDSTVEIDAQTETWFDTFCTGLAPFGELISGGSTPQSAEELGTLLTTIGQTFTDTASELEKLPPPTFDGGSELATTVQQNMAEAGPVMLDFGERAATIDPADAAAQQQFATEFQAAAANLQIAEFSPSPEAKAAAEAVPSCVDTLGL